jgi:imidazolonepropionase
VSSLLITNIGELVTNSLVFGPTPLGILTDAAILVEDDHVSWVGLASEAQTLGADARIDAQGAGVIPGFVDSHAHLMFAGDRAPEFEARMSGLPYIAGGIRTTVAATRAATDDDLRRNLVRLISEANSSGTTTIECKSGYGLTVEDEARSLRLASEVGDEVTFLGAHVVPDEFGDRRDEYVSLVIGAMLDACVPYSRWIDVFCDRGAFDPDSTREILKAGISKGLLPRLHANQLEHGEGVQIAVEFDAASADHCTHLSAADIEALASSATVATLLPAAEFSTRSPYPNARALINAGATVAIATDCNPGSSYTTNMPFCIALAVREMQMTPAEALLAATLGGAKALRRNDIGRLVPGGRADFVLLNAPSYLYLAYRPGVNLIGQVFKAKGKV